MHTEIVELLTHGSRPLVNEFTIPCGRGSHAGRELCVAVNGPWAGRTVLKAERRNVEARNGSSVAYASTVLTGHDRNLETVEA